MRDLSIATNSVPPPPPESASACDLLIARINLHGRDNGYAVRKQGASKLTNKDGSKGDDAKRYIVCHKSGQHKDTHTYMDGEDGAGGPKRKGKNGTEASIVSRKTGCPFKLYCSPDESGAWSWKRKKQSPTA